MNFLIKGAYGETNFGDDLLMVVFENFLIREFPQSKLNFSGTPKKYVTQLLHQSNYNQPKFQAELIIFGGGTQFFSFSKSTNPVRRILLKIQNALNHPHLIAEHLTPKHIYSKDIPHAFLGFGVGPFNNDESETKAQKKIKNAFFVGVRDSTSAQYCQKWKTPNLILGADVVFSSYANFHWGSRLLKNESIVQTSESNTQKQIGVIIRDWNWEVTGSAYIQSIRNFADQADNTNIYTFIVFAPDADTEWLNYLKKSNHK